MSTLDLIKEYGLLVRPSWTGGWRAGMFRGVTGNDMPQAYSYDGTEWQADTLEEAVEQCAAAIRANKLNPDYLRMKAVFKNAGIPDE